MYPADQIYSADALTAWRADKFVELRQFRRRADQVLAGSFIEVGNWDELRAATSFLTLMNKRCVLYFRGQGAHFQQCLPTLFRNEWSLNGRKLALTQKNRGNYYAAVRELQQHVFEVSKTIGTPRYYLIEHFPAATAAILQHYELWPTHLIDVTRSLPIAVSFATGIGDRKDAYLYVFAMPDLRGSITSDIDQHLSLSRLEAICPPDAKRPHHQDAYLIGRFPEPQGIGHPGDKIWDDWQRGSDLMNRLVAKFHLTFTHGTLPGTPIVAKEHLLPDPTEDKFGRLLYEAVLPVAESLVSSVDT